MKQSQTGVALLVVILVILVGTSYFLLDRLQGASPFDVDTRSKYALKQARDVLLAYAVIYSDRFISGNVNIYEGNFGILPCPDSTKNGEEGNQDSIGCGERYVNVVGRLPWQTLGIPPLKDGDNECLWYAVSSSFKHGNKSDGGTRSEMINEDSVGMFQLVNSDETVTVGDSSDTRPVAVIFAPGAALPNQERANVAEVVGAALPNRGRTNVAETVNCGGSYKVSQYLEIGELSDSRDNVDRLVVRGDNTNDLVLYLTAQDIFDAIKQRKDFAGKLYDSAVQGNLTQQIAACFSHYLNTNKANHSDIDSNGMQNTSLPWPSPVDLTDYREDENYNDQQDLWVGRLPIIVNDSNNRVYDSCASPHVCDNTPDDNLIDFCHAFWNSQPSNNAGELVQLWQNWKDHLFYAVAQTFWPRPIDQESETCAEGCVNVGGNSNWAAVVIFSNSPLRGQIRTSAPPTTENDTKSDMSNYIESTLSMSYRTIQNSKTFSNSDPAGPNDVFYCIDANAQSESRNCL